MSETSEQINQAVSEGVTNVKQAITAPLPHPPSLHTQASPREMKERLDWGEPALTILDIRDREAFGFEHIKGAMCMPLTEQFVDTVCNSLEPERDIYLYGNSDEETAQAASQLRQAGFSRVAELKGNLDAWKTINGPVEGYSTFD